MSTSDELDDLKKAATPGPWDETTHVTSEDLRLALAAANALPALQAIARAVAGMHASTPCPFCSATGADAHAPACAWVLARRFCGTAP